MRVNRVNTSSVICRSTNHLNTMSYVQEPKKAAAATKLRKNNWQPGRVMNGAQTATKGSLKIIAEVAHVSLEVLPCNMNKMKKKKMGEEENKTALTSIVMDIENMKITAVWQPKKSAEKVIEGQDDK